jgi:hypothetical protein
LGAGEGVGSSVGKGFGGIRGSGNPGSGAAANVCVRFQSGPNGAVVAVGAGVTIGMAAGPELAARPKTRSPMRLPIAMAAMSTTTPAARTTVMKRLEGSMWDAYCSAQARGKLLRPSQRE